jgi:GNAT superfamily N-acetyltransferase
MELIIRPAGAQDAKAIYELNRDGLGYDFPLEDTRRRLAFILGKAGNRIFVAQLMGRVVGYIHAADYECSYTDSLKNIIALAVDEKERGRGIGRVLLNAAEAWARETGAAGVRLNSGMERENAHRFYEACGYINRKNQKNFIKHF